MLLCQCSQNVENEQKIKIFSVSDIIFEEKKTAIKTQYANKVVLFSFEFTNHKDI